MTLTAPPPVQDPVRRDIDDAVIKEAKRRARRRRRCRCRCRCSGCRGAGRDTDDPTVLRVGFVGLPPEGAAPSSPTTGELEFQVMTRNKRIWVYADGRMISIRLGALTMPEAANRVFSGFLEQHLSPEGIEFLRSYLVNSATRFTPMRPDSRNLESLDPLVRMGDEIVSASVRGCGWEVGCQLVAFPEDWLPVSAWTDQQFRAYVPTAFQVCYGSRSVQVVTAAQVLAAMPPGAAQVLSRSTDMRPQGSNRDGLGECAVVSTADARIIDRAVQAAGFQHPTGDLEDLGLWFLSYWFDVPPAAGQAAPIIDAAVEFRPVLPHGLVPCAGCG